MTAHLNAELSAEIREATAHLPLYDGAGVNYRGAEIAYTASITLLHLPNAQEVTPESDILLVQKGRGDWHNGVWGAVSGYIDTTSDPNGDLPDTLFDPLAYTVRSELAEECSLSAGVIDAIDFYLGRRLPSPDSAALVSYIYCQ